MSSTRILRERACVLDGQAIMLVPRYPVRQAGVPKILDSTTDPWREGRRGPSALVGHGGIEGVVEEAHSGRAARVRDGGDRGPPLAICPDGRALRSPGRRVGPLSRYHHRLRVPAAPLL